MVPYSIVRHSTPKWIASHSLGLQANVSPVTRVQRISSYAMSIFTSLHLCNVSLIPAVTRSVPASESYLLMTREIYQTTLSEPLLVALPVVAHVGSGIALRLVRWQQNRKRYGRSASSMYALHKSRAASHVRIWPRLSYISMSGYAFSVFYSAHVFMNRILPLVADGDSSNIGLAYVAHGFARHPIIARAAYLGLIGLGSGHMIWGMAKWLGYAPSTEGLTTNEKLLEDNKSRKQRKRRWLTLHGIVVATIAAWGIGGLGVVARGGLQEGWVGAVYDELFSRVDF